MTKGRKVIRTTDAWTMNITLAGNRSYIAAHRAKPLLWRQLKFIESFPATIFELAAARRTINMATAESIAAVNWDVLIHDHGNSP
jgi:hypothetical protein